MNIFRKSGGNRGIVRQPSRKVMVAGRDGLSTYPRKPRRPAGLLKSELPHISTDAGALQLCVQRRLGGIGDVLMTTPSVKALKESFPTSHLIYATDPNYYTGELVQILEHNPYIDEVVDYRKISPEKYHLFVDITGVCPHREKKGNPPVNRVDMFAEYIGIRLSDPVPVYVVTEEEKTWATQVYKKWFGSGTHKVVVLHTASVDRRRTWPVENYINLIAEMNELRPDVRFVIFDHLKAVRQWDYKNCVDASDYGIRQKAALLWACDVFVGPDSGPMHIAGALNKNMVTLFGSTDPAARINYYDNSVAVTSHEPCSYCWYSACVHTNAQDIPCMSNIQVKDVVSALGGKLDGDIPEVFQHHQREIVFNIDPACDMETVHMATTIAQSLAFAGVDTKMGSQCRPDKDILVDVVRLSANTEYVPSILPALANYCIATSLDDHIDQKDTYRVSKGYTEVLSIAPSLTSQLFAAGVPTKITTIRPPMPARIHVEGQDKTCISFTEYIIPENLRLIDPILGKLGCHLNLHCSCFTPGHKFDNITVTPISSVMEINRLLLHAWAYLDLNGYGIGWYTYLALACGIPSVVGDYPQTMWIPSDYVYKVGLGDTKPLIDPGTGKLLCHYHTLVEDQLVDALSSMVSLRDVTLPTTQANASLIISESQTDVVPRLLSLLARRLTL
jgi:ADP-heptose:LPS heptosyltransferase